MCEYIGVKSRKARFRVKRYRIAYHLGDSHSYKAVFTIESISKPDRVAENTMKCSWATGEWMKYQITVQINTNDGDLNKTKSRWLIFMWLKLSGQCCAWRCQQRSEWWLDEKMPPEKRTCSCVQSRDPVAGKDERRNWCGIERLLIWDRGRLIYGCGEQVWK